MIFTEKIKPGVKDTGKDNKIKNRAILEILENVGSYHSDKVGYGVLDIENTQLTWILLDWKLKVLNRPKYGQTLTINTWGRNMQKFFTYRDYEIYDESNNLCVIATSKWALINVKTGKLFRLTEDVINRYSPELKQVFNNEKIEKLIVPEKFSNIMEYKVIRKDIDLNGHLHNLYYLDLAYEALPEDVYENRPFDNIEITYKKEIKIGDKIICKYSELEDKHVVVITSEDESVIYSIINIH